MIRKKPIPDLGSGVKKAPDPGSPIRNTFKIQVCEHLTLVRIWPVYGSVADPALDPDPDPSVIKQI